MSKIAIIADKQTCLPFSGIGIEAVISQTSEEAGRVLRKLSEEGFEVIFISESLAANCVEVIEEISERKASLTITIVPDFTREFSGVAEKRLKNLIKKAVGMELPE
ncbi:MAG: V-type ATP synthase subunit F [bacterium]